MSTKSTPLPLFDSRQYLDESNDYSYVSDSYTLSDIEISKAFLKAYRGNQGTFNSYRREIERLIHWAALIAQKSLKTLNRADIEAFVSFCQNPPRHWIGTTKPPRFVLKNGKREPNIKWRPFVTTLSKSARRQGKTLDVHQFELANDSVKELFAILSSFYNYLLQEEYALMNPVALIRQKSKFIRKVQETTKIRRLTDKQWQYVIKTAQKQAEDHPLNYHHARTLFIMSALYLMYLRISELAENDRWTPKMNDFHQDHRGDWWFTTVGKGNKERQIALSPPMLAALKTWREHLQLSPLPSPADHSPLLPKIKGKGSIKSINLIRTTVQDCFDRAIEQLILDGFQDEANSLNEATVHWLRHTGISDDVKIRPREHVRDDAGHSSSAITDRYIDIELHERYQSAQKKRVLKDINTK
jgi:site-specific recombinase XerD